MKKSLSDLYLKINQDLSEKGKNAFRIQDTKYIILVDGNKKIPNLSLYQKAIIGGDRISKSISAASIIAKVIRDRVMRVVDKLYPQYCFAKNKGYGTQEHLTALREYGPCPWHRKTFRGVKELL